MDVNHMIRITVISSLFAISAIAVGPAYAADDAASAAGRAAGGFALRFLQLRAMKEICFNSLSL